MVNLDLTSLTTAELDSHIGAGEIVVIAGSGISGWEPTTLPTGQDFSSGVRDALFLTPGHPVVAPNDITFLEDHLKNVPFEMIMERCPNQITIGQFLSDLYSGHSVNEVHKALGDLAKAGKIHSIITTNYDLGIDTILAGGPLTKIVKQSDVSTAGSRVYFKIHGCASDPKTMIFSLKQESELPPWKKAVLSGVIAGRPLVLIGYSGFDFEICPELPRCSPTAILWNFYSDESKESSPGLKHLMRMGVPQFALLGDMCKLFSLLGVPVSPTYASGGAYNIGEKLRRCFTNEDLLLWRARVLVTIGHSRLALAALKPLLLRSPTDPDFACEYAQALFHNGQYRSSAQQYLVAADSAPDERFRLLRQLDACDALRCFGSYGGARDILASVNSELQSMSSVPQDIVVRALLKEMLLIRNGWHRRKSFLMGLGCRALRNRAKHIIQDAAPRALREGLWLDFQQLQLWADRFELPDDTMSTHGGYVPLSTLDGYRHLGYYIPRLMHIYDLLYTGSGLVSQDEVENGFDSAAQMGCHPVAWKLARGAAARFHIHVSRWKDRYKHHLGACQYTAMQGLTYRVAWSL